MAGLEWAFPDLAIIIPPTERIGQPVANTTIPEFMWLRADRSIIEGIVESIEFPESPTALEYVQEVLRYIHTHYIYLDQLDWEQLSAQTLSMVHADSPIRDAHPALEYLVEQVRIIGYNHTGFITPENAAQRRQNTRLARGYMRRSIDEGDIVTLVYPGSPADEWGLQVGDVIESINGLKPAEFEERISEFNLDDILTYHIRRPGVDEILVWESERANFSVFLPIEGRRIGDNIGYIETFGISTEVATEDQVRYVAGAHDLISEIDSMPTCGWIVDLRRNTGGDTIIMALAYAPLLGNGVIFGNRRADDSREGWLIYDRGVLDTSAFPMWPNRMLFTPNPYTVQQLDVPIAVLVSAATASNGEFTAMAFKTRPNTLTQIFGEETRGFLRDGLISLPLWDGALMYVVDKTDIDRDGQPFPSSIIPDVPMGVDYTVYGTDDDPMIQAATTWLEEQPECQ